MLIYSSLLFITNALHALYKKHYLYSFSFFLLSISSVLFYSFPSIYTNLFDKLFIFLVVLFGASLFIHKLLFQQLVISLSFLFTIFFFYFGYFTNSFCYGPYGNDYHLALHFISSIGHHLILI